MSTTAATLTVSQSEVENLLAEIGGLPASVNDNIEGLSASPRESIPAYQFPPLSFFSAAALRKLRLRHENFVTSLAGRLSIHLGMEIGLQLSKLETVPLLQFSESLPTPTHLTLVKIDPLRGTCLLDFPPHLGLSVVDRELGGPGISLEKSRELGAMEARLLARVVEIIVSEWCSMWSDLHDLRPVLLQNEHNARFLQIGAADLTMLVVGISLRIAGVTEQLQFAFPHFTLEPLIAHLNGAGEKTPAPVAPRPASAVKWNSVCNEIPLRISAQLPEVQMTARQISQLKLGDVIPFQPENANQVRICLGSVPKFVGSFGTCQGGWAVKISSVLKS